MFHQIFLTTSQLDELPLVDWDILRPTGEIVPKIFDELKLFGRAEVENGACFGGHGIGPK